MKIISVIRTLIAGACALLLVTQLAAAESPREHLWAAFKTRLRKGLATATNPFLFNCYIPNFLSWIKNPRSIFPVRDKIRLVYSSFIGHNNNESLNCWSHCKAR